MPCRQVNLPRARLSFSLVILPQSASNFVRLHADDRVLLRIEVRAAIIHLYADQVFVQFFGVPGQGLFRHEFQEAGLLGGIREVLAMQDATQFFPFLVDGNNFCHGAVLRGHGSTLCQGGVERLALSGSSRLLKTTPFIALEVCMVNQAIAEWDFLSSPITVNDLVKTCYDVKHQLSVLEVSRLEASFNLSKFSMKICSEVAAGLRRAEFLSWTARKIHEVRAFPRHFVQ